MEPRFIPPMTLQLKLTGCLGLAQTGAMENPLHPQYPAAPGTRRIFLSASRRPRPMPRSRQLPPAPSSTAKPEGPAFMAEPRSKKPRYRRRMAKAPKRESQRAAGMNTTLKLAISIPPQSVPGFEHIDVPKRASTRFWGGALLVSSWSGDHGR